VLQLPWPDDRGAGKGYCVKVNPDAVQHINLKIFIEDAGAVSLDEAVKIFHRWIKDNLCTEMMIDVADYQHVPAGPGVMLIGHEANYSLDNREKRLGLLYNRKAVLDGTFQSRLAQAHEAALAACQRLEAEELFRGKVKFDRNSIELAVNDRLLAPNNDETWSVLEPRIKEEFPGYTLKRVGEPRDLFRVSLTK
jgi:hypothetical protein